jgi:hypothetical protein
LALNISLFKDFTTLQVFLILAAFVLLQKSGYALYAAGVAVGNANPATGIAPGLIQASRMISPNNPLHQLQ